MGQIEKYRYDYIFNKLSFRDIAKKYGVVSESTLRTYSNSSKYNGLSWNNARKAISEREGYIKSIDLKNITRSKAFQLIRELAMNRVKELPQDHPDYLGELLKATKILVDSSRAERLEDNQPTQGASSTTVSQENNFYQLGQGHNPIDSKIVLTNDDDATYQTPGEGFSIDSTVLDTGSRDPEREDDSRGDNIPE